ncbi:MAG TPA: MFS transporter [Phototrophicaceae bacterium]|nr:MFS transporter [Phototrophicaceae bacterium]
MELTLVSPRMRVFVLVWLGQLVSLVGSALTSFALGLWVYEQTHSVTHFALTLFFRTLPVILLSPIAGALVDRWDKRRVMIFSDLGAAVASVVVAALLFTGRLEVWHIYAAAALSAACGAFQVPAYQAASTLLVSKEQLGRANGLVQTAQAAAEIAAPLLAGVLVVAIRIQGILLIDVVTFLVSVTTLLLVRFPQVPRKTTAPLSRATLTRELGEAARYILTRPGLVALTLFFAVVAFQGGLIVALVQPMVLSFTTPDVLGLILSGGGFGVLLGSLVLSAWGGPQRRTKGIMAFLFLFGGGILLIGAQPSALLVALGVFSAHFCAPFINGLNQAIWQTKVAVNVQGRVFALRQMVVQLTQLVAFVIAGPLADTVFGPLLAPGGAWADSLGQLIGVGAERGAAVVFLLMGLTVLTTAIGGALYRPLQQVETTLPDVIAVGD